MEHSGIIAYTPVHRMYGMGEGSRQFSGVSLTSLMSIQIFTVDVQASTVIGKCDMRRNRLKRTV